MTIVETAKITSKGQITIPNRVRKLLHIKEGQSVAFCLSRKGILLYPCKITIESLYTSREWSKIKNLASVQGKIFEGIRPAKQYIESL